MYVPFSMFKLDNIAPLSQEGGAGVVDKGTEVVVKGAVVLTDKGAGPVVVVKGAVVDTGFVVVGPAVLV